MTEYLFQGWNCRLPGRYEDNHIGTEELGHVEMLAFLIVRHHMHQNQWLAAIEQLESDGIEDLPVPAGFPLERETPEVGYQFISFSDGEASTEGRWAHGTAPDGTGDLQAVAGPQPVDGVPGPPTQRLRLFATTTPDLELPGPRVGTNVQTSR